uniref:G-patch domain-containing protein n=1 Tax=Trichogramma kaykai TaxID=54128 RepID=A0ABD2X072_9HYME
MADEEKKISFGFSKSIKKPTLKNVPAPEKKKVEYIQCVDDKNFKIIGKEEEVENELVIPMTGSKTWHDRIVNKVDADIYESKTKNSELVIKEEKHDDISNGTTSKSELSVPVTNIKKEPDDEKPLTLEEQAAREIISDLRSEKPKPENNLTVPIGNEDNLVGQEQSTLEDYENIPIEQFGIAMLRGMGWKPDKGIGKNEKVVAPAIPELRPKGMGLGADKLIVQKARSKKANQEEGELKLKKFGYVRILAGKNAGLYGQIEGFDEHDARLMIKLALGGDSINIGEQMVEPVTADEYLRLSKVLNINKYQEYKNNERAKPGISKDIDEKNGRRSRSKERYTKKKKRDSSDSSSESKKAMKKRSSSKNRHRDSSDDNRDEKSRKTHRRNSSDTSEEDYKPKKSKKSKKHKNRDISSERLSHKNRKKEKEREKTRHRRSDYSDPSERARNKHRRRSRSSSHSPKSRRRE